MKKKIIKMITTFKIAQVKSFNFQKKGKETTTLKTINIKRLSKIIKPNQHLRSNKLKKNRHRKTQESPMIAIHHETGTPKAI
jgi:hypothetical protein